MTSQQHADRLLRAHQEARARRRREWMADLGSGAFNGALGLLVVAWIITGAAS